MSTGHLARHSSPSSSALPVLSHARIQKYLTCPEQYRLHYVEGWRPRQLAASLLFGRAIHMALAELFQTGEDPVAVFQRLWNGVQDADLLYRYRESWEKFLRLGETVLERFVDDEMDGLGRVIASEYRFELSLPTVPSRFIGIVDAVALGDDGGLSVVDFKTAAAAYKEHEAALSDQLTAYLLAFPNARRVGFCVFTKTAVPKIAWHWTNRDGHDIVEFLHKVGLVGQGIQEHHFYKRPGRWCQWCDFLPICARDTPRCEDSLVQGVRPEDPLREVTEVPE